MFSGNHQADAIGGYFFYSAESGKGQNMSLGHLKDLEDPRAAKSKRQKKVRDESTGEVLTQIHQVDCWKDMKDIWWNPQEMVAFRAENHRIARYFRRRRHDYIQNIQFIA